MPCTFFENWAHAKIKYLLPVCQTLQKFTEGNARKCTVSFSFCAHVDAIKYWKTLADVFLRTWRITCAFILRVCVMAKLHGARNFWFSCKSQLKVNTLEMLDFGLMSSWGKLIFIKLLITINFALVRVFIFYQPFPGFHLSTCKQVCICCCRLHI